GTWRRTRRSPTSAATRWAPLRKSVAVQPTRVDAAIEQARAWTMRTLRSLFPRPARRRLRFRGGWFALPIYVLLVLIYPLSLQQAEWVRTAEHFTWLALLGIVAGMLVGNGRMSPRRAVLFGGLAGAIAVVIS